MISFIYTTGRRVNNLCRTINNYRNNITNLIDSTGRKLPRPNGLNAIKYSYALEKEAEEIAMNCQYYNENGFNSFFPPDFSWVPKKAVDFWMEKLKFYNYENNECDHDMDLLNTNYDRCRTARQLIDDSVSFIGCGWSVCARNDDETHDTELFVCKFDSVKLSDERPYQKYVSPHNDKILDSMFENLHYSQCIIYKKILVKNFLRSFQKILKLPISLWRKFTAALQAGMQATKSLNFVFAAGEDS